MKEKIEFVDFAKIYVKAGDGGNGCVSFRREKYIPFGGPDGGNGGKGGDIYIIAKSDINTLTHIANHPHVRAKSGEHGKGSNLYGRKGEDEIIYVPCGTIIKEGNLILADLKKPGDSFLAAKGGKGGRGNLAFKTHKNTAPKFCEMGQKGEEKILTLELSLLADVGLAGFPNAGKSTLLSKTTLARPKIADYPFTTLSPNLGVVKHKMNTFLMADIPGLIENAHEGKGLGHLFLKHIMRTKIIIHLIDPMGFSQIDPIKGISIIENELKRFSKIFDTKEIILAVNKADLPEAEKIYKKIKNKYKKRKVFLISSITGNGIDKLFDYIIERLPKIPNQDIYEKNEIKDDNILIKKGFFIEKISENTFKITGKEVEDLAYMTNFEHEEGVKRMINIFKKIGLIKALKNYGIKEGDLVKIVNKEFEWQD
jgi:GTP-binding protein